jgi:hypothetical protein
MAEGPSDVTRSARSEWAAVLAWTTVVSGGAGLLAVLWTRGALRCGPLSGPCVWAGPTVWWRASLAVAAGALAGRAFVPFIRGFVRYLERTPGRVPFALGLWVAAAPAAAVAATYVPHRSSLSKAELVLWPYHSYEPFEGWAMTPRPPWRRCA